MNKNISNYDAEETQEQEVDLIEIFTKYLRYWKWFVLSVAACLIVVAIYLRYVTPVYEVKSAILLKDDKKGGGMADMKAFSDMGLFDVKNNVDNEIEILKTVSLMEGVVKRTGNYVRYTKSGNIKTTEIYGNECPVLLSLPEDRFDSIPNSGYQFDVQIEPNGKILFTGEIAENDFKVKANRYDSTVTLPFGKLMMRPGLFLPRETMEIGVTINRPIDVAQGILGRLNLALTGKTTSVVNVNLKTVHVQKGIDLLKNYVEVYNQDNMNDQNLVAQNTAKFLEDRLSTLTGELSDVEQKVESYKQSEQLTDITSEAQLFLKQSSVNEDRSLEVETQLSIIKDLENYINKKENQRRLLPAGTGIQSQNLNALITSYNELLLQHNKLSRTATANNQAMMDLNYQIDALADNVKASIAREKRNLMISRDDINRQNKIYESRIRSIPRQEREYMEIQRQQSVKSALYLFLLQKKEENYLSMTVVVPKAKVIDQPRSTGVPVSPKRSMLLLLALMAGLAIPVVILFIREKLKFFVENKAELEKMTIVPILGEIPKSEELGNIVLHEHSTNTLAEMYRLLRTNLLFVSGSDNRKVIIVTSSVGGEGKTFMSMNLGLSLAFLNKKVLVIGLDVRKPKLAEYLGLDNKTGITMFLSGHSEKSKLIRPSGVHKNLDIIPAGPIPPNPNELLARQELDDLIAEYRTVYDYIILDTAPVGAVSDTFSLDRFSDVTLYLVRAEYTHKQSIAEAEVIFNTGKLKNLYFVLNASDIKKASYRYGYGKRYGYGRKYGYGSGYGYGYGNNEEEKK